MYTTRVGKPDRIRVVFKLMFIIAVMMAMVLMVFFPTIVTNGMP